MIGATVDSLTCVPTDDSVDNMSLSFMRVLVADMLQQDLSGFMRRLTEDDIRAMVAFLSGPWRVQLDSWLARRGLPGPDGGGFWVGTVLPLMRRRLTPRSTTAREGGSLFDTVKAAVAIETLAGKVAELRPAGPGRLKALCPLHAEKTPSFVVYTETQRWRCYGACGVGGDVIELARRLMAVGKL